MKIPKTVKIGGQIFKVRMVKDLHADHEDLCGDCDCAKQLIRVRSNMPKDNKVSSFLHEVLEAICGLHDIKISHQTLTTLETALYQVLKDNDLLKE